MGLDGQEGGLQVAVEGIPWVFTNESPESSVCGKGATSSESVTEETRPTNALTGFGKPVFHVFRVHAWV